MVRFRLDNEMKKGKYWKSEKERRCRMCGGSGDVGACMEWVYGRSSEETWWEKERGGGKKRGRW